MKILITNDDGIYSEGIKVLYDNLKEMGEVMVVAPLIERSTTGHTLSLDNPLRVVEVKENFYGCSGYPADCTLVGLGHLFPKKFGRPDLVVSGINKGSNLGQDVYYSGTVAAAREGAFHDIPGIAVSTAGLYGHFGEEKIHYNTAGKFIRSFIEEGAYKLLDPMTLINVNVPNIDKINLKGIELTELGFRHYSEKVAERKDFRDNPYYWVVGHYKGVEIKKGTDTLAVENNVVSITPLNLLHRPVDKRQEWKEFLEKLSHRFLSSI